MALLGVLIFGSALALTFFRPAALEASARNFIKAQIERETHERIDALSATAVESRLGQLAAKVLARDQARAVQLRELLKSGVDAKVAAVVAEMADLNCECRRRITDLISRGLQLELSLVDAAASKVEEFLRYQYMEVTRKLTREMRIFLGSNFTAFLVVLIVAIAKPKASTQLLLPALMLGLAVVTCSYFYLFGQNWFYTIIYDDYLGFVYLGYLGIAFAFLIDIVVNRARVCTEIVNGLFSALGSAVHLTPC